MMLYAMTMRFQPGLGRDERNGALARRAEWRYPAGMTSVGEYWPASENLAVVAVFEAESYAPIMEVSLAWTDVFQIEVSPAFTPRRASRSAPR